jgi:Crinkler effector protein N-terminal domain
MANEDRPPVWVKLVIDGDDRYDAFQIKITSETNNVDDLKEAIMEKSKHRNAGSFDGASLKVYRPETDVSVPEGAEPLRPGLLMSSSNFPSGITDQTPLIVTAMSRQQQHATEVSFYTERLCTTSQFALRIPFVFCFSH